MRPAGYAWTATGVGIAVADVWLIRNGHDSMSTVFGDLLHTPAGRAGLIFVGAAIVAHLYSELLPVPEGWSKYDPIGYVARRIPRKVIDEAIRTLEAEYASKGSE